MPQQAEQSLSGSRHHKQFAAPKPCFSLNPVTSLSRFPVPKEKGRNLGHAKDYSWTGGGLVLGPKIRCVHGKKECTRTRGNKRDLGRQMLRLYETWASGELQEQVHASCALIHAYSTPLSCGYLGTPVDLCACTVYVLQGITTEPTGAPLPASTLTCCIHPHLLAPVAPFHRDLPMLKGAGSMGRIPASAHSRQLWLVTELRRYNRNPFASR